MTRLSFGETMILGSIISKAKSKWMGIASVMFLFALSIIFFHSILSSEKTLDNIHYINDLSFESEHWRKFFHEDAGIPLWTPYFYGGQPFLAIPEYFIFDLNWLLIFLLNDIILAMNLSVILYFFLGGVGIYLLMRRFEFSEVSSLCASVVFLFNGFMLRFILTGHINLLESYALLPYAVLFFHASLTEKRWTLHSILCGITLALMVLLGGAIFTLYCALLLGIFGLLWLIGGSLLFKIKRGAMSTALIIASSFGLSAIKLLPTLEFTAMSSRAAQVSYSEYLGNPISFSSMWDALLNVHSAPPFSAAIGFISLILIIFGLLSFRKRFALYGIILILVGVLLGSGSFLAQALYSFPGFNQMRHIERALVLFVFGASILAAYGSANLSGIINKKMPKMSVKIASCAILLILTIELFAMASFPKSIENIAPQDIPIISEINSDEGNFRVATLSLSTPIGASGYNYYTQLNISEAKGGGGIWIPSYVEYLAIAHAQAPSTLFGILSAKYLISDKELDDPSLVLKKTLEPCLTCPIWEAFGPYLYENKKALEPAMLFENSLLLIGNYEDQTNLGLSLLLSSDDVTSSALINGNDKIASYTLNDLSKYSAVLLLRDSVTQSDLSLLELYVSNGGVLLPDITKGENALNEAKLVETLQSNKSARALESKQDGFNRFEVSLDGQEGWIVLSERFAHFPGWKATIDGKEVPIFSADSVISAVYSSGGEKLELTYSPSSFRKGSMITFFTLLVILLVFSYLGYRRFLGKEGEA